MSVFKCKMCGGTIEFEQGATVGTCDSCGTKQTLPKLDDERKANLYDRANHFRRNNDFDKAVGIYETILNEDKTDAEAYWSIVLCKYGIEYVEDPASHKRVPTVNRTQFASVLADEDYKSALEYATIEQKIIYEKEAKAIDEIQKGILEISNKEEPFDVFICYKETDNNGRRTHDSVLANDLYHQLTQEGFKVFFSRITLEDKLGTAYEPYIFAALNSAKVMVVIGTKPEYFNAVWVKNEWSRYLALIKKGAKKVLIPAYKDMDPYDLPEEFSHLQAQDMSKLGFMQDLIRGIKKLTAAEQPKTVVKETAVVNNNSASSDTAPMIKRIFLFLEDGDWKSADEYCEKVLDKDPENGEAYLGKLMIDLKVKTRDDLQYYEEPFDNNKYYAKVCRFNKEIGKQLKEYNLQAVYNSATKKMNSASTGENFKEASNIFATIKDYKDSNELSRKCMEDSKKIIVYNKAINTMKIALSEQDYLEAARLFDSIQGFKDSGNLGNECRSLADGCRSATYFKANEERKNTKKVVALLVISITFIIFVAGMFYYNEVKEEERKITQQKAMWERIRVEKAKFSHLEWSSKKKNPLNMNWEDAVNYCENLNEGGHNDWRLPTISELRSLIKNCSNTEIGGECNITDNCLSWNKCMNGIPCSGCKEGGRGKYSIFEDSSHFWSSSVRSDKLGVVWTVTFWNGSVNYTRKDDNHPDFRCVRQRN